MFISWLPANACRHAVRLCNGARPAGAEIHARGPGELDEQPAEILHGDMVQPLRVKVDREARRLAGYRYGRQIADDYLTQLGQGEEQVARWLEAENDRV